MKNIRIVLLILVLTLVSQQPIYAIKWNKANGATYDYNIVLDPSYGGDNVGSALPSGVSGPTSADLCLECAKAVRTRLEAVGATVAMTRTTSDKNPSLTERKNYMFDRDPWISCAISLNASTSNASGCETYYYWTTGNSSFLAGKIQSQLVAQLGVNDRGIKQTNNMTVLQARATMPAACTFALFSDNASDYNKIKTVPSIGFNQWVNGHLLGFWEHMKVKSYNSNLDNPVVKSISRTPTSHSFGNVVKNQTVTKEFTINSTCLTANITVTSNNSAFTVNKNSVGVAANQKIIVTFKPTAAQSYSGTITLSSGTATQTISVNGIGIQPTTITAPANLSFGNVNGGSEKTLTATIGGTNLQGNITVSSSGNGFTISPTNFGTSGGTLSVTFKPTAAQAYTGTITLSSPNADNKTIALTGTGVFPVAPNPSFSPTERKHTSAPLTVTLTAGAGVTQMYYTLDGSKPTTSSSLYNTSTKITITKPGTTCIRVLSKGTYVTDSYSEVVYSISPNITKKWSQSHIDGYFGGNNKYDNRGMAVSLDGTKLYRPYIASAIGVADGGIRIFDADSGSQLGNDINLQVTNNSGGSITVSPKGYIYVVGGTVWNDKNIQIVRANADGSGRTEILNYTTTFPNRLGWGIGVWEDASGNGYVIMHKCGVMGADPAVDPTNTILYWNLTNSAISNATPTELTLNMQTGQPSYSEYFSSISIVDKDHFWISGHSEVADDNIHTRTPVYCTITWGTNGQPTAISGTRVLPGEGQYLNQGVSGATQFNFDGKRYGIFAVNNHTTDGGWNGNAKYSNMLIELSAGHNAGVQGNSMAIFPYDGLASTNFSATGANTHYMRSAPIVKKNVYGLDSCVTIITQGSEVGTACYEFTAARVEGFTNAAGNIVYHFGHSSYDFKLNEENDLEITTGATVKYIKSATGTPNTTYTTSGINFTTGENILRLETSKPNYFTTVEQAVVNVGPVTWNGGTDNWGTASKWKINTTNISRVPKTDEDVVIDAGTAKLTAAITCGSLQINANSTVQLDGKKLTISGGFTNNGTIDIGSGELIVNGSFQNNGTIRTQNKLPNQTSFDGTIEYYGSGNQIIHTATYNNLKLSKTGVFTLPDQATVKATNNLTLGSSSSLEIASGQSVDVGKKLTNPKGKDGILIKSAAGQPAGTLIFQNADNERISATVEMYAYGSWTTNSAGKITNPKWQYFGIPFHEMDKIEHPFYGAIIRRHHEAGQLNNTQNPKWKQLNNQDKLYPIVGYELSQPAEKKYTLVGELYNQNIDYPLSYTSGVDYQGQHILSNPYTAAIDISKINFINTEAKVYVYNSGSLTAWKQTNTASESDVGVSAGQYIASSKQTAGQGSVPGEIPPMQGFLVKAKGPNASIEINYADVMKATRAQRAPEEPKAWLRMNLDTEEAGSDVMWLFSHPSTTRGYDDGWDGQKMVGDTDLPLLFSRNETGDYQINAQDNIHNTDIAFKASSKTNKYTITFHHGGGMTEQYDKIYLKDKALDLLIDITEDGRSYSFISTDTMGSNRFKILVSKDGEDITEGSTGVYVYTINHQLMIENHGFEDSRIELYDTLGRMVAQFDCPEGQIKTEHLHLSTGSYIARIITSKIISKKLVIQ